MDRALPARSSGPRAAQPIVLAPRARTGCAAAGTPRPGGPGCRPGGDRLQIPAGPLRRSPARTVLRGETTGIPDPDAGRPRGVERPAPGDPRCGRSRGAIHRLKPRRISRPHREETPPGGKSHPRVLLGGIQTCGAMVS